jgi:hypothetical protein
LDGGFDCTPPVYHAEEVSCDKVSIAVGFALRQLGKPYLLLILLLLIRNIPHGIVVVWFTPEVSELTKANLPYVEDTQHPYK